MLSNNEIYYDSSKESWARGVQWELTRMVYPSYVPLYSRKDYTGVVQDMIDGFKTTTSRYHSIYEVGSYKSYSDQVPGYTIRQLEDALRERETWADWKTNIKHKYNNATEDNLELLFNYWD